MGRSGLLGEQLSQYDLGERYAGGFINSSSPDKRDRYNGGYNYIAQMMILCYTGITSVTGEGASSVFSFAICVLRKARYYPAPGGKKFPAMNSARVYNTLPKRDFHAAL
jgi:hypothetical protein